MASFPATPCERFPKRSKVARLNVTPSVDLPEKRGAPHVDGEDENRRLVKPKMICEVAFKEPTEARPFCDTRSFRGCCFGISQPAPGRVQMRVGVAQMDVNAAQTRLLFAGRMREMLLHWACKAEAGPTIMRGTMDPQRDRQNGDEISQDESGFLQRLFRRARDPESRGHTCRAQAANSAAAARVTVAVRRCISSKLDEKMFAFYYELSSTSR
jgi:hypothetical protein